MDIGSLFSSLATSLFIFMLLILLFGYLSRWPRNFVIYCPNHILKGGNPYEPDGHSPSSKKRSPFAWIKEAFTSTEQDIISKSSVDAAVYFVFLFTALGIIFLSGLVLLPVLLPVAATEHKRISEKLDKYSIENLQRRSPRLWAFVVAIYWVSLVSYYLLWKAYKHVTDLRASALMSWDVKSEQFAVLVRDIPPLPNDCLSRKEQVNHYFRSIYPDTFYKSIVITNSRKASKIWEELKGWQMKLQRAESVYCMSHTRRPTNRTGLFGLIGEKVDTIGYVNEKIIQVTEKLEAEQKIVTPEKKQCCSAIVLFTNRVVAASAPQCLHDEIVDRWTVMAAPEPRQIIWKNLHLNFYERRVRQYVVYALIVVTIVFYTIPIGMLSALTTLDNLEKHLPSLKPILEVWFLRTVLEAYLPQLGLLVFLYLLPKLLMFLSEMEGTPCVSQVKRATSAKYFYFTIVNSFIGVTMGVPVLSLLKIMKHSPKLTFKFFVMSLPSNAAFFMTFVSFKCFVGFGIELSRIMPLILYKFKKKYICKAEVEVMEAWAPRELDYTTRFPIDMLIFTIVICYSTIAPLMIIFGVSYFGLEWIVMRNQVLKVYIPSYESQGRMWPHIHTRMVAAILLFQVIMLAYVGFSDGHYTTLRLVPLPIITLIFSYVCWKKFYRSFECIALRIASQELRDAPDMEQIYQSFVHPSLQILEDPHGSSRSGSIV